MAEKSDTRAGSKKPYQLLIWLKKLWLPLPWEPLKEHMRMLRIRYLFHIQLWMACVFLSLLVKSGIACSLLSHFFESGAFFVLHSPTQLAIYVATLVVISLSVYVRLRPSPCYLVDFCCTKGDDENMANTASFRRCMKTWKSVNEANLAFQFRVFCRSGIGEETYAPRRLLDKGEDVDLNDAREETQDLIETAVRQLLQKTRVEPKEIDIVILNSSLFNPVPSLTAYLVKSFKMRSNVRSFNLAGMGCSAGLIAVDLAKDLLRVHRNSYALVVSTENITSNMYFGNDRSMMVSNCLFRCGAGAILLTNKASKRASAKLKLIHCLRTHMGAEQGSFTCVTHREDDEGNLGVSLQLSLMEEAGKALRVNITKLAPLILPVSELLKYALNMAERKLLKRDVKAYEPDFKMVVDHFCIHPGGKPVINSIGRGLRLSPYDIEPGLMALNRFGNTSSSGIWYALAYCEAKGRLKKGDKVWQIALGSGFKCNSAVWTVLKDIQPGDGQGCNPWLDCIESYPVDVRSKSFDSAEDLPAPRAPAPA